MLTAQPCPILRLRGLYSERAPLCMGLSKQEYWSGCPFSSPGNLPDLGIEPCLLHRRLILYRLNHRGSQPYGYLEKEVLIFPAFRVKEGSENGVEVGVE